MALWKRTVGAHGYSVTVTERRGSRFLHLTWWDSAARRPRSRSLKHADRDRGQSEALALAAELQLARTVSEAGIVTLQALMDRFGRERLPHDKGSGPQEGERRMLIWLAFLGPSTNVASITRGDLERFAVARKAGALQIPDLRVTDREAMLRLSAHPSARTVGQDLEFLRRVLNWGRGVSGQDDQPLVSAAANPFEGFVIPTTARPRRPLATYERWQAIRAHADEVDAQRLFGGFCDLLDGLGWRVTALCELRIGDLDLARHDDAPYGRLRKRGEIDKEGVEMWVPLSRPLATASRRLLRARQKLGATDGASPVFPAIKDSSRPWSRYWARALLRRAERSAGLPKLEGGDFHPYRRAWATARKSLPTVDVAEAGAWRTTRMVELYQQADPGTMLAVVSSPARVRRLPAAGHRKSDPKLGKNHGRRKGHRR